MLCRFCKTPLRDVFVDLYNSPASNSFLTELQLNEPEAYYPLKVFTCEKCFLVQIDEYKKSDAIFDAGYVYFSSYSRTWLAHAKAYTDLMSDQLNLHRKSLVVEIASNDGYLLQYFKEKNIPVLGVEPTEGTAEVARNKGIETIGDFFGSRLATQLVSKGIQADLLLGNNVLAHVPDIVDFVAGMKIILKPAGVITMEFPHLMQLVNNRQFDTIYHEHFSYLSFLTVKKIFESQGLELFKVDEIPTHGGSLRIYGRHQAEDNQLPLDPSVKSIERIEKDNGLESLSYYHGFQHKALSVKFDFINFLLEQKRNGKTVVGYGAAAKGNTLLNYCGVKSDLIDFVVDANPHKQSKFLPGSHIPVQNEEFLKASRPDFVVIFPWNLKEEIMTQLQYIREWGGKFVAAIPQLEIF